MITHQELRSIFKNRLIWSTLANQDISMRYRRSYLGPFWLTLNMMITIYAMGFLYAYLFKMSLTTYFPYLSSGIIAWTFLSTIINEGANVYTDSENYIRNAEYFLSVFSMRLIVRNLVVFSHNILAFLPIMLIFHVSIGLNTFFIIPALFLIALNGVFWGTVLGVLGARFRDFPQILSSFIQVIFFLTPIMWMPSTLPPTKQFIVDYNPLYHFVNLLRAPFLNQLPSFLDISVVIAFTLVGFFCYFSTVSKYKDRVVFWL